MIYNLHTISIQEYVEYARESPVQETENQKPEVFINNNILKQRQVFNISSKKTMGF